MFTVPRENRYFEDYVVGAVHEFGSIAVTEGEIIAFALRYDPQLFHIDPIAAKNTYFGGLIASGWHTSSLMGRLFVEHVVSAVASLGSPGGRELRWIKPVRPDDVLSIRVTIREAKRSQSKPDRGVIVFYIEMMNQSRETVVTMEFIHLCLCREKA
jgi:acyl dehydratase